jgi:hypothetical protein
MWPLAVPASREQAGVWTREADEKPGNGGRQDRPESACGGLEREAARRRESRASRWVRQGWVGTGVKSSPQRHASAEYMHTGTKQIYSESPGSV